MAHADWHEHAAPTYFVIFPVHAVKMYPLNSNFDSTNQRHDCRYNYIVTDNNITWLHWKISLIRYRKLLHTYRMEISRSKMYIYISFLNSILSSTSLLDKRSQWGWKIEKLGVNQSIPSFNTFNYSTAVSLHRVLLLTSLPQTLDTCHILPLRYIELPHVPRKREEENCTGIGREFRKEVVYQTLHPITSFEYLLDERTSDSSCNC